MAISFNLLCYVIENQTLNFRGGVIFILLLNSFTAQSENILSFKSITTDNGLSNNNITSIYRDSKGFLWIGTVYGLNRSDANKVTHFFASENGLNSNHIWSIFEDYENNIWIRTNRGTYSYYNYQTNQIYDNVREKLSSYGINIQNIRLIGCKEKYIWVYGDRQIYIYDFVTSSLKTFSLNDSFINRAEIVGDTFFYMNTRSGVIYSVDINTLVQKEIFTPDLYESQIIGQAPLFHIDKDYSVWVYTLSNSLLLHKAKDESEYREIQLPTKIELFNKVAAVADDNNGNTYIITNHHGAFVYNKATKQIHQYTHDSTKPHTLLSDNLTAIHIDNDGIVWIGNNKLGVSYYVPQSQAILNQVIGGYNDVLSLCEVDNSLYIGTDGSGLLKYSNNEYQSLNLSANVIVCIYKDSKNRLWLGTYQSGLVCVDGAKVRVYNKDNSGIAVNDVYGIKEDSNGNLYLALLSGYIQKFEPETATFTTIHSDTNGFIRDIVNYNDTLMYAATGKGLLEINTISQTCHYVSTNYKADQSFNDMYVNALYLDSRETLWMGTTTGLSFWNLKTDKYGTIDTSNGLSSNMVTAICEDLNGQIWIGTCNGVSCITSFRPNLLIHNYYASDGLISSEVNQRAICRSSDGKIYLGTPQGYSIIYPKKTKKLNNDSNIILSGLSLANKLEKTFPFSKTNFTFKQKDFPIELDFSTLDFKEPHNILYEYLIENHDSEWQKMNGNSVVFPILSPGSYNIKIRSCDSQGLWSSNHSTINLKVLPAWYLSGLAMIVYFLIIILSIYFIVTYIQNKKKQALYLENIERQAEEQKKLMNMKLSFFANISHEFRTPLSLIINPLEEFIKKYPQYNNKLLSVVRSNANYLSELIDQLLSFRKIDANGETMIYSHSNIVQTAHDVFIMYSDVAKKNSIDYTFSSDLASIKMDYDSSKMTKIIHNLLSNAFKFTPVGGRIAVELKVNDNHQVVITVSDTGIGIAPEEYDKIFDMFYQVKDKDSSKGGSGIGLFIVSQYVKMHNGSIGLTNNEPQGSIFTITLPQVVSSDKKLIDENLVDIEITKKETSSSPYSYTLLLVDDNLEFLDFLCVSLSSNYNILKAVNGSSALDIIGSEDVDLVISDVMMPDMSGLDLCKHIKSDIKTSHIPVILLTAMAGDEFKLEGIKNGADDYISKPFNMEILKLRIDKFIENSNNRHQAFEGEVKVEPSRITITPLDQKFIEKAIMIVEDNLKNVDFSVEELASQLNISRGYLYRKLIKITGKSTFEFIRVIRMKRAQQLLAESQMQVAEVAYLLGYNSPKTFTKHFKEVFNILPSQYLKNIK